jgi:hypothetical protein
MVRIWGGLGTELCLLLSGFLLGMLFHPEDGGSMFHQTVGKRLPDCTTSTPEDNTFNGYRRENLKPNVIQCQSQ